MLLAAKAAVACDSCNVTAINSGASVVWTTKLNALLCTLGHIKYFAVTVNVVNAGLAFLSVSDCQA